MENKGKGGGKHVHRTPISIDNPEVRKDSDWWDELCEAHGAKNYWSKNKNRKEQKKSDEKRVSGD
jgi:hypothetical protein